MPTFGQIFKQYRERGFDPESKKRLSQGRVAELLEQAGGRRVTSATISNWERDKNVIGKDDRLTLIKLLKVFHQYRCFTTLDEVNHLLWAGNYRSLDKDEQVEIFTNGEVASFLPPKVKRSRLSFISKISKRKIAALAIIVFLIGGMLTQPKLYSCLKRVVMSKSPVTLQVTVYADGGWQNTGVCVFAGDTIEISEVSGYWTGDMNSEPQVDANGYSNSQYNWLDFTQANWGALIGAVGPRQRFLIGLGTRLEVETQGFLSLRMNDASCPDCVADNKGQVKVVVTVRDHLSSQAGTTVLVDVDNGGLVLMETTNSKIVANAEHISGQHTNGGTVKAGELITVTFRVQNTETHPIKIVILIIGARGPNAQKTEWRAPNVSFPSVHDLFLQPGEFYEYRQSYAFKQLGDYFIEPVIQDALGRWGGIQPFTRIDFSVIQ